MRRNTILRTPVALAAAIALLGACSASGADTDDTADTTRSSGSTPSASTTVAEESPAPDVLALPGPDPGRTPWPFLAVGTGSRSATPSPSTSRCRMAPSPMPTAPSSPSTTSSSRPEAAGDEYGVPRDPCTGPTIDPVGPTVDDLVNALAELPIYRMTRPEPVELGGADGTHIPARIPRTYDASACEDRVVRLPGNPDTAVGGPPPYVGRWWILDVDGQRVVLQQNCWGCTTAQLDRDASVLQSITFTSTQ